MRDLFPGWVPPDAETLDRYWSKGIFAVDTSVLLDLYRFSGESRERLLKALRSFGERLWIPHQVALEYHRNRLGVLLDQREAESNLLRELDQIRDDLDAQLSRLLRGAGRRDLAPLRDAIDNGFDRLREKLKKAEKEHTRGLGESIQDDPIYEEIVELCSGRVGPPFNEEQQDVVLTDAEERFQVKKPPGYLDDEKGNEDQYGDVVLWHQLCHQAIETKRPVVLITDDQKTDWVWEVRGKVIGPRPELVAEMSEKAGVGFYLYTPTRFLEIWEQREKGREVEPHVLAEIAGPKEERSALTRWLMLRRYLEAYDLPLDLAGESPRNPWIPRLMQSMEQLRPRAFHSIRDNAVDLTLEYPPMQSPGGTPLATVIDPNGRSASASSGPTLSGEPGEGYFFQVRYPDSFKEAKDLSPGAYQVLWEISPRKGIAEGEAKVATDSFVIEG